MSEPTVETFRTSDGYLLHYRHFSPSHRPARARIVALHGIQSHGGWYTYSSQQLARAGFEVCFLDRRGSGLNQQRRGDAPHADRLINDVVQFLLALRMSTNEADGGSSKIALMGVSWGGKLAATVAARRPELVDALALLYPGIYPQVKPRGDQRRLIRLGAAWDKGSKRVKIPLGNPALFTADPRFQTFIAEDPLALHEVTVSFLNANLDLDQIAQDSAEKLLCPVLLMLAGKDQIIDNEATRQFFGRIGTERKRLVEFTSAQHTLEFEPNRDEFIAELTAWLAEAVPTVSAGSTG